MGLEPNEIDPIQPLTTMGLDSLMAIELKNKIERQLQLTLPMSAFMSDPTVTTLAANAADIFGGAAGGIVSASAATPSRPVWPASTVAMADRRSRNREKLGRRSQLHEVRESRGRQGFKELAEYEIAVPLHSMGWQTKDDTDPHFHAGPT